MYIKGNTLFTRNKQESHGGDIENLGAINPGSSRTTPSLQSDTGSGTMSPSLQRTPLRHMDTNNVSIQLYQHYDIFKKPRLHCYICYGYCK